MGIRTTKFAALTIHFSEKVNAIFDLPSKHLWGYTLENIKWKDDTQCYVISISFSPIEIK